MARQANITLTALAQHEELMPDIPIRRMTLNHRNREVILGRASLKGPRPGKDGGEDKKTVSRIAQVDNGYMSRNETIASEHAALFLRKDGEVWLEHRAGHFPPTFLNGEQVIDIVPVQNNDIINLGPLRPYSSKHKQRTYYPFALKLSLTFEHILLSDDENSSSSSSEDEEAMSVHDEVSTHHEHPDRLEMIRGHQIIEVSDEDRSELEDEDGHQDNPPAMHSSQSSKNETVIIDLTQNEVEHRADTVIEQTTLTHINYAQYDSSSEEEFANEEISVHEVADLEDDIESIDDDSIFGDDHSNAPSEHPIERRPVSTAVQPLIDLNYCADPDLDTDDLDFAMNEIEDGSEDDENDVDYEEPSSDATTQHENNRRSPYVSEELSKFQEAEARRIREKEQMLEKAGRLHDTMREEQQKNFAQHREILAKAEVLQSLLKPKHRQEEIEHGAPVAEARKIHEPQPQQINYGAAEANRTPPAESITAAQMCDQTTTKFHQESSAITQEEFRSNPPAAQPFSGTYPDFYPDEAFHFHTSEAPDVSPVTMVCQPVANTTAEFTTYMHRAIIEPPHHTQADYSSARAENKAKMYELTQDEQFTPPNILMSSSLFGQPIAAGLTLPPPNPKQVEDPYARFRPTEKAKELNGNWSARQNGKVSINDLVEHEEEEDASSEELEDVMQEELAKPTLPRNRPTAVASPYDLNQRELEMYPSVTGPVDASLPSRVLDINRADDAIPIILSNYLCPAYEDPNFISVDGYGFQASMPEPETSSKKRKHVEFEEFDTVISPASGPEPSYPFEKWAKDTTAVPAETKHVHFAAADSEKAQKEKRTLRPIKRLRTARRVAERAAYAVLGAAVAGVSVFAALAASAPEDF